jgi:hypothetical protein
MRIARLPQREHLPSTLSAHTRKVNDPKVVLPCTEVTIGDRIGKERKESGFSAENGTKLGLHSMITAEFQRSNSQALRLPVITRRMS